MQVKPNHPPFGNLKFLASRSSFSPSFLEVGEVEVVVRVSGPKKIHKFETSLHKFKFQQTSFLTGFDSLGFEEKTSLDSLDRGPDVPAVEDDDFLIEGFSTATALSDCFESGAFDSFLTLVCSAGSSELSFFFLDGF
jgi:hypothetical protein